MIVLFITAESPNDGTVKCSVCDMDVCVFPLEMELLSASPVFQTKNNIPCLL